ncbi:ABC transporter substrate-binding protein [Marinibacterium sp. SX1]|uniref:ABC transporter substrate-binding protein n=1 Tax=Marinibacterium sp. SX1 TaxID=3388424 RepID=UPI003D178232
MELNRRQFGALGLAGLLMAKGATVLAQGADSLTIAWPSDVPNWDPNLRFAPDAQPIYKLVYDQPLDQDVDLNLVPGVISEWEMADDGLSLKLVLRDDVTFHDGTPMTAKDVAYTFMGRRLAGHNIDVNSTWGSVETVDIASPTELTMNFSRPMTTAPQWLAFLGSYVVSKAYVEEVGEDGLREKPMGTGPYKLVQYDRDSRIVLEAYDGYWGGVAPIKTVTIQIVKDPSARLAAIQSGQVDLTIALPVRDTQRLEKTPGVTAKLLPITRIILLMVNSDKALTDDNLRLALSHAVNKDALSRAFYGGAAVPIDVAASPGTPGYVEDYDFAFDPELAKELLAKSGYGPDNPAKISFATTNGQFPSDYDIARALVQMWGQVGIEAELEVIEYAKYFELTRAGQLPDLTLYSWDNATGDPEIYAGYLLNPNMPFSPWKTGEIPQRVTELFGMTDYDARIEAYKQLVMDATDQGVTMPLLQSVLTVAYRDSLEVPEYKNGWILANKITRS